MGSLQFIEPGEKQLRHFFPVRVIVNRDLILEPYRS
jgi:hypothetical protein